MLEQVGLGAAMVPAQEVGQEFGPEVELAIGLVAEPSWAQPRVRPVGRSNPVRV